MNTKRVGNIAEAVVLAEFVKLGIPVLQPFGDTERYDLVIEVNDRFYKIQCKHGRYKHGCVEFETKSASPKMMENNTVIYENKSYAGQIDFFACYCSETGKCYLMAEGETSKGSVTLRVEPSKNGQTMGVKMAADFELPTMITTLWGSTQADNEGRL